MDQMLSAQILQTGIWVYTKQEWLYAYWYNINNNKKDSLLSKWDQSLRP